MRKLTITLIFAAGASRPQAQQENATATIKKTFQYPNGARIEATHKIYGESPCDGACRDRKGDSKAGYGQAPEFSVRELRSH